MLGSVPLPVLDCRRDCKAACCRDVGVPPYTIRELFGVPARLRAMILRRVSAMTSDPRGGVCFALDTRTWRCRIYKHRPSVCVNFEIGSPDCKRSRERYL